MIGGADQMLRHAPDMSAELRDDTQPFIASMRVAHDLCDKYGDVTTTSLLDSDGSEKRIRFLYEMCGRRE